MLSFMFAVLGSTLFWIGFVVVGFFAGCLLLRFCIPDLYELITEEHSLGEIGFLGFIAVVGVFLFWPIIVPIVVFVFLAKKIFWPLLCKSIKATASVIPDIEIKHRKDT